MLYVTFCYLPPKATAGAVPGLAATLGQRAVPAAVPAAVTAPGVTPDLPAAPQIRRHQEEARPDPHPGLSHAPGLAHVHVHLLQIRTNSLAPVLGPALILVPAPVPAPPR